MMSFLGSYKTEIGNSLKQIESQGLEGKGQKKNKKKRQENLEPSPFRIAYKKKLWHAPQTQSKTSNGRVLKNPKLPGLTVPVG